MTQPEKRSEALLSTLKDDLPSQHDEARIRRRLTAAGLTLGAASAVSNLTHAAVASTAKVATTSSAPAGAALSGAATVAAGKTVALAKASALVTTTWASLATGTKLAVVSVAIAGGAYPVVGHWNSRGAPALATAQQPLPAAASSVTPVVASASGAIPPGDVSSRQVTAVEIRPAAATTTTPGHGPGSQHSAQQRANGSAGTTKRRDGSLQTPVGHGATTPAAPIVDVRLREETALIERALVAVRANDTVAAARWLGEHEQRFPSGVLVTERERLRASLR